MMHRSWTSRSTAHLAGPALLAVLAILAASPAWSASTATPRLAVAATAASLVALAGESISPRVTLSLAHGAPRGVAPVSRLLVPEHIDRQLLGLHRLVLPPPSA